MIIIQPVIHSSIGAIFGRDKIEGTLKDKNNNIVHENIFLYSQSKKHLISSQAVDERGVFSFKNINIRNDKYFLVAHSTNEDFNGVIADNIGGENVDN